MAKPTGEDFIIGADLSSVGADSEILTLPVGELADKGPGEDALVLELADLLPDAAGEVVLFAGEDFTVNLKAGAALTASGVAEAHVTASGVDVW